MGDWRIYLWSSFSTLAFSIAGPVTAQPSIYASNYVGMWCGEDSDVRWQRIVSDDGTYQQFNQPKDGAEAPYRPHLEFGRWSITDGILTTHLDGLQFGDELRRPVDPAWTFTFYIVTLTEAELEIEMTDLHLLFRSTRDCLGS